MYYMDWHNDVDDEADDSNIKLDETDYAKEATKMNLELMEAAHLIELNEAYQEFNRVMTESYFDDISDVIMEADANPQPTVNTGGNDQGQKIIMRIIILEMEITVEKLDFQN